MLTQVRSNSSFPWFCKGYGSAAALGWTPSCIFQRDWLSWRNFHSALWADLCGICHFWLDPTFIGLDRDWCRVQLKGPHKMLLGTCSTHQTQSRIISIQSYNLVSWESEATLTFVYLCISLTWVHETLDPHWLSVDSSQIASCGDGYPIHNPPIHVSLYCWCMWVLWRVVVLRIGFSWCQCPEAVGNLQFSNPWILA